MKTLDGNEVLRIRRENPSWTWAMVGVYLAKMHDRRSREGQLIPYTGNGLRNAIKRVNVVNVTHTGYAGDENG